jgi:hypothetical protein
MAASYHFLSVLIAIAIRAIPEALMGPWPSGFDVITYYAPYIYDVKTYGFLFPLLRIINEQTAPLTYLMLSFVGYTSPLSSVLTAKIMSPLIYGFLAFAVYLFVEDLFKWEPRKVFFATVMTVIYFVCLRFSWDMWKNMLGLAFFLLAVRYFEREEYGRFTVYSVLCILTHEVMTILLGSVLAVLLSKDMFIRRGRPLNRRKMLALTSVACLAFIGAGYYSGFIRLFPAPKPSIPLELLSSVSPMTIPYNYLGNGDWYNYTSENNVRIEASTLMIKMYGPILPLAILGWTRDEWMNSYVVVASLPFISVILAPRMAIPAWHRFAFLLTVPLTIYAANFLFERKKLRRSCLVLLAVFAFGYAVLPPEFAFPYYVLFPVTYQYMPTSMLQNSVSQADLANVEKSLTWLSSNAGENSCLLTHESYLGWARLYINREDMTIVPYNLSSTTPAAAEKFYAQVYLIWWARNMSWYDWSPPAQFSQINQIGRISIYKYVNN